MALKLIASDIADRNRTLFDRSLGVVKNGEDNLYPTRMERAVNASVTAKSCASMYAKFMFGQGFVNDLETYTVGKTKNKEITPNGLLQLIAKELAKQPACFIHVNYNANFKIISAATVPYRYCRFSEEDDSQYSGKVIVYDNWDKSKTNRIEKSKFKFFDTFNPSPDVIKYQVEKAGGFHKWNGQILYFSLDNSSTYPLAHIDVAVEDAESEHNFSVFRNETITDGFFTPAILRHSPFDSDKDKEVFKETIANLKGAKNRSKLLLLEDEFTSDNKDGNLRIDKLDVNFNEKLFDTWESTVSNNIRKCFKNIPVVLVDYEAGKLGNTSGESFTAAQKFYNSMTSEERQSISMLMKTIFDNFYQNINPSGDWSIKELELMQKEIAADSKEQAIQKAQAELRGSVGGVTSLLAIQTSVAAGTTTYDSGVAMLKYIYGYDENVAKEILGQIKSDPNVDPVN